MRLFSKVLAGSAAAATMVALIAAPALADPPTGVTPKAPMLELYRLRWDIADIAIDVSRFRRPHTGSAEDDESFGLLSSLVRRASNEIRDDR